MTRASTDEPVTTEDVTAPLRAAIAEAEQLVRGADFIRTEQDLLEGLDYLSGRIRMAMQMAFDHDLDRPVLINSTHQFSRQGLDNPDAIYHSAFLVDSATYLLHGRRGSTADLSFQVMDGTYNAEAAPGEGVAFDDRGFEVGDDGSYTITFAAHGSARPDDTTNWFELPQGAKNLIIREVYSDWTGEQRGSFWIERPDMRGVPRGPYDAGRISQRYAVAAKMLTGSIQTWFAFPKFFTYPEPVNTLTAPKSTPGGLPSQFSSIGHYDLAEDQALVVVVPACREAAYQAIQIGSDWYVSTDYETHQTSLTAAQSVEADGELVYVISEQDPGVANWLETLGHAHGVMMLRWQRLTRALTEQDGPRYEVVPLADLFSRYPSLDRQRVTPAEYADRIVARQAGVAARGLS